jgi:D-alanyl-D-alanine dipeptidase
VTRTTFGLAALVIAFAQSGWSLEPLPPDFIRLSEVAPSIRQDIRYAMPFNFTGQLVPGYEAGQCILRRSAAEALVRAQAKLTAGGFGLKVYDCYRPARAVRAFLAWSRAIDNNKMRPIFYPGLEKSRLFALGYISSHSRHSTGGAVDIGLVGTEEIDDLPLREAGPCDGPFEQRAKESSLDLGTAFDCFSERSATANPHISVSARLNRERLRKALDAEGFRNYAREWWHFEYVDPSVPLHSFDFPVQ